MSEFFIGEIANAKVGRNLVEVEILECGEGNYKVKSISRCRRHEHHYVLLCIGNSDKES